MSGGLLIQRVGDASLGDGECELGVRGRRFRREGGHQRANFRTAAVEHQSELAVDEQARSLAPVAGGLCVADRLHGTPV